jgi:hypothetical protein
MKTNLNKLVVGGLAGLLISTGVAVADDNELEVKSDQSRNPITGTVTETKKYKKKNESADGRAKAADEVTETKKIKKDGSVEKKTEADSESSSAAD